VVDHVSDLKLQYLVELSKLGDRCAPLESELERWLGDHGFLYGERTIPFVIMPHFISPGQLRRLSRAVASISPVLDRFCDAYCEDPRLREALRLAPQEDALVRIDPGFPNPIRVSRLDAFSTTTTSSSWSSTPTLRPEWRGRTCFTRRFARESTWPGSGRCSTRPTRRSCRSWSTRCSTPTAPAAEGGRIWPRGRGLRWWT
jgi:hypothetical protein